MKYRSASGMAADSSRKRVDRVRGAVAVDVDPADLEARVGRRRDDGHEVAVLGRRDLAIGLLPRLPRRHEHDLVEVEPGLDLTGGHEVAVVDGVERATHDADASARCVGIGHGRTQVCSRPLPNDSRASMARVRIAKAMPPTA